MSKEAFFLGHAVDFKGICHIYPPKISEVLDSTKQGIYTKLLTLSQEELEDEYVEKGLDLAQMLTPFEYILNNAYHQPEFLQLVNESFFFYIHEPIRCLFEEKAILIGDISGITDVNKMRILRESDYFAFQNLIREATGLNSIEPPNPNEDPRIKKMKARARYRDKVKMKKGGGLNLRSSLASICCMNMGLNPLNIGELSYAALPVLVAIYQQKEKYQLDIDSLLAGADSKKVKPKYWIANLEQ